MSRKSHQVMGHLGMRSRKTHPSRVVGDPYEIAAGESFTVICFPQVYFRPTHLLIPEDIARRFTIEDIKAGNRSLMMDCEGMPASLFAVNADSLGRLTEALANDEVITFRVDLPAIECVNRRVGFPIVMPTMAIQIRVRNDSIAACEFKGALWGECPPL